MLFETDYSFQTYQDALRDTGFRVLESYDLSQNLKKSYQCLSTMARGKSEQKDDNFQVLSLAYDQMVAAIDNNELGWALYVCRK